MTNTALSPISASHTSEGCTEPRDGDRASGRLLVLTGALGLLASLVITLDEFKLYEARAAGETFTPGCSLNPVVSCGSVMESSQAHVFGFPNPVIGLVAFAMVIAVGASLLAGIRQHRWYWLGLQACTLFGVGFCTWLQFQSLYRINALCLWCCLVWTVTITLFSHVTTRNITHRVVPAPAGLRNALAEFPWTLPVLWTGTIGMLILARWWDFWTS
ncbi:vitamin K epoxide reductase family protein [Streptomyces sp. RKAG337]|uniref:vitamin K epoxide reductase family protein n=1 Tax=Streptomyces sp. RKAG337 TaxID=2893404 RepID=UPI002033A5E7|nr:vitamin K epoxide reductase family protein [Streptomyces sp. RKAG337]MCM2425016.1 vitamin K epoxide reductase family protein [Streptomyces sp. RKAG337]